MNKKIEKTEVITFDTSEIEACLREAANMPADSKVNFQFRYEDDEAYLIAAEVRHSSQKTPHSERPLPHRLNYDPEAARNSLRRDRGHTR